MIASVTPWEQEDPNVQTVLIAAGKELDRIEELMELVRDQAWPHHADDTYGLLSMHERAAKLSVAPEGLTVAARQQRLKSVIQSRRDGRKGTWASRMNQLVGVGAWRAEEATPGANQITVYLNALPSTGLGRVYQPAIERFTPAAVQVFVTYEPSFIIGESPIGDTEL